MPQPRCKFDFFDRHHVDVARDLLGCTIVWDGCSGTIVETEAYAVRDDPACHTFSRPKARAFFEEHEPGIVYAYISYGVHWLLNVLTTDGIILFRALEPVRGIDVMKQRRGLDRLTQLCSGPGKLGQALSLCGEDLGSSLLSRQRHIVPPSSPVDPETVTTDVRVGLSVGLDKQWRFLIEDSKHISVKAGKAISKRRPAPTRGNPKC